MKKSPVLLLLAAMLVALATPAAFAQKDKYRNKANDPVAKLPYYKKLRWADGLFRSGSYFNAIDYYQQLKQEQDRNPYLTYQLAESYQMTRDYVPAAKYYGDAYALAPKLYPEAVYKQAMMLKMQGQYDSAINRFNQFIADNPKTYKKTKLRAKREIEGATMAKNSVNDPVAVTMKNAGPNINSAYTESAPYPLGDTALLFSSMVQNQVVEVDKRNRGEYMSRFLVSHKQYRVEEVDSFQWPLKFNDGQFNDPRVHVGNGVYSPGGERFYFTKCGEEDSLKVRCRIYVSKFEGSKWSYPEQLGEGINDEGSSSQPFVAKVGKKEVLFFSSNRKIQSRGGYDIWYSIIDPIKGTYRRAQNVGKQINTEGDEVTPYYDPRVGKLYFASNGWVSMGGFDIFSADGGPSRYANVMNLGYPINTSADELYYIKDPVGKPDAYLVSNRIGSIALKNPTCCDDIWRIQYEPKLTVLGKVMNCPANKPVENVVVKLTDETGQIRTYNSTDGNFSFNLARGHNYVITGDKPRFRTTRGIVNTQDIKRTDPDNSTSITICLDTIGIDDRFRVSNVYYDFDRVNLRPESMASLDTLVAFMRDNASLSVEIYSFADAKGTDDYNRDLSLKRAMSVRDYLVSNGINNGRMLAKAFGETRPAAPNTTPDGRDYAQGRQLNRRTEFRIISEDPTRRVIFNSAMPGSMDQQKNNLMMNDNMNPDDDGTDAGEDVGAPGSRVNKDQNP